MAKAELGKGLLLAKLDMVEELILFAMNAKK